MPCVVQVPLSVWGISSVGAPPPAAEEPAAGSLDDLFAPPKPAATEPAAEPAPAGDDIFGAPPAATEPAADPFGAPPAEEEGAEPATTTDGNSPDDLFGASPTAEEASEPAATTDGDSLDDLFGAPPAAEEAAEPAADPFGAAETLPTRLWTDNTGTFQVRGRLAVILETKIRILKDNGRYTTVPLRRLSDADQDYVEARLGEQGDSLIAGN